MEDTEMRARAYLAGRRDIAENEDERAAGKGIKSVSICPLQSPFTLYEAMFNSNLHSGGGKGGDGT